MFRELYKNDNQMITPSDELLAQISERIKAETDKPTKLFWLKMQPLSRVAATAAVVVIAAVASVPFIMNNSDSMKYASGGGSSPQVQNDNGEVLIQPFAVNEDAAAENELNENDASKGGGDLFFIEEAEIYEEAEDMDEPAPAGRMTADIVIADDDYIDDYTGELYDDSFDNDISSEYIPEEEINIDGDEIYEFDDRETGNTPGSVDDSAVVDGDYEMACDYLSYTEWASADVWDSLVTADNEPVELIIPENDNEDIYDSPDHDDMLSGGFSVFEDFAREFLSGRQQITMFACPNEHGVYPAEPLLYYGIDNSDDFYAPVFAMLVKNLGKEITYLPEPIIDPYISPYYYGAAVIKIGVKTENSFIAFFIDDTDRLVIENVYYKGIYELMLEAGTYRKLWNYVNYYGERSQDDVAGTSE